MERLAGKVAFVTGAAGGIGAAICRRFVEEGANVLATDLSMGGLLEVAASCVDQDRIVAQEVDVTKSESVLGGLRKAMESFGKLDILCNVAGGSTSQDSRVTEAPEAEFWRAINLDLFGTFICCKHGIPKLIETGGGSIINFSSMVALMSLPERDCYTAAKGGVAAITRSIAHEYASVSVRVNAIAPGLTLSERTKGLIDQRQELRKLADQCLLGICEPIDMAEMAVFLGSNESRRVTGQIFPVDSGVTIY